MTLHVPRYVPLTKAAIMLNTSMSSLNRMIQSGKIKAVEIAGEIAVSENSLFSNMKKEDLPDYKKFAHLAARLFGSLRLEGNTMFHSRPFKDGQKRTLSKCWAKKKIASY
jgi:hypothetical protein